MNRPHPNRFAWALGLAAAVGFSLAQASSPWSWLKDTPASRFTDQDWTIMRAAHAEALEQGANGVELSWENPATGNSGSITPLNTVEGENGTCRDARIVNRSGGVSGDSTYRFCQQPDATWLIQRRRSEPQTQPPVLEQE